MSYLRTPNHLLCFILKNSRRILKFFEKYNFNGKELSKNPWPFANFYPIFNLKAVLISRKIGETKKCAHSPSSICLYTLKPGVTVCFCDFLELAVKNHYTKLCGTVQISCGRKLRNISVHYPLRADFTCNKHLL